MARMNGINGHTNGINGHHKEEAFPIISATGSPRQLGLAHGQQARELVKQSVTAYKSIFRDLANMEWDRVRQLAASFEPKIKANEPDLFEEMEGVAEGSGCDLLDIIALNVRTEISLAQPMDGCTSFSKQSQGDQWICQNWDWKTAITQSVIILHLKPDHGQEIKIVTEAGIIGKIGLNASGVCAIMNAIKTPLRNFDYIPVHLLMRRVLQKGSVKEVQQYVDSLGACASSVHIMVADKTSSVSVEATPVGFRYLYPNDQTVLAHTNHLLAPELKKMTGEGPWLADSDPRLQRIRETVAEAPSLSHETNRKLLSDRTIGKCGICRHEGGTSLDTLFSISINATHCAAQVIRGKPDEGGPISDLVFA